MVEMLTEAHSFHVQIRTVRTGELFASPVIDAASQRTVYAPAHAVEGVREVMILFDNGDIRVDEISIFGPLPTGADPTERNPAIDTDVLAQIANAKPGEKAQRAALLRQIVERHLQTMRAIRSGIDHTTDSTKKADGWMNLNEAADRMAMLV